MVEESRVVYISVVPGSVFVIGPITVVDWNVLLMIEEVEAIAVVLRIEGLVSTIVVFRLSVGTTVVV